MTCLKIITKAQKGLEGTDAFAVGEQLKEICEDPACAELAAKDLETEGMGLKECAAKIKAYADAHRVKGAYFSFVSPMEAEASAAETAAKEAEEKLQKLKEAKAKAEKKAAEAAEALEEARKQRTLGSPEAAVFKVLFQKVQEDFQQMAGALSQVEHQDPELAEKLRKAVRQLLASLEGKANG